MILPTLAELENELLRYRVARRSILKRVTEHVSGGMGLRAPWLVLTRSFARVKSADSLLEKARRKSIALADAREIHEKFTDVLGLRLIVDSPDELPGIEQFITDAYRIHSRIERRPDTGEFSGGGIEFELVLEDERGACRFELQLRTYLQHCWAVRSFHLFHKQPAEAAQAHADDLHALAAAFANAERISLGLAGPLPPSGGRPTNNSGLPLCAQVNVVAVEAGERFVEHRILPLSGDEAHDHAEVVAQKLDLYARYPGVAVVECSCFDISALMLNEPVIRWPAERWNRWAL